MPNYTENLQLEQPLDSEQYDVAVTRRNNAKIDQFAGQTPPYALAADKLTSGAKINGVNFKGDADIVTGAGFYYDTVTYGAGNLAFIYNQDGALELHKSLSDGNIGHNPLTSTGYWEKQDLGSSSGGRNIGEIVTSAIPLEDAGLHLLDGTRLSGDGIYKSFVDYIAGLDLTANYFCTESEWQQSITDYGVCGKFVYDSVNNTVRLPKYGSQIWTQDKSITAQRIPVKTTQTSFGNNAGALAIPAKNSNTTYYVKSQDGSGNVFVENSSGSSVRWYADLSTIDLSTQVSGYYYIVVANSTKTDIQVDIDEVVTDLNNALNQYKYDGQWVGITGVLLYNGNSRTSDLAIDISNYIPNDNYNYEILVWAYATSDATSGSTATCSVNSDIITDEVRICQCRTRTSSNVTSSGNAIIPIHNRVITIVGMSNNTGSINLCLVGYRRIGTNS